MSYEQLKLDNQLCFPVYAASRLIIREYQPLLDELGVTYPQYLVLMVLWEHQEMPVNDIAKKLLLNTNTITPLLKRMEIQGLVKRERSVKDERKVIVKLTEQAQALEKRACLIPEILAANLQEGPLQLDDLLKLKEYLMQLIDFINEDKKE